MPKLYDLPVEFRIVDVEGVVLDNPGDYLVVQEPKDFRGFRMVLERLKGKNDEPRHGFNFDYGEPKTPMVFIKAAGYQLIQDIYDIKGNDAKILIEFGSVNPSYVNRFRAFIDGNTYKVEWVNHMPRITMNVENEAIVYKLSSRQEAKVNLLTDRDFDKNALTPLEMEEHYWHGKVIKKSSRFESNSLSTVSYFDGARKYRDNEVFFISIPNTEIFNDLNSFAYNLDDLFADEGDMDGFFHLNAPDDGQYLLKYKGAPTLSVDFYNSSSNGTDVVLELCYKIGENGTINVLQSERGEVSDGNVFYGNYGNLSANGRVADQIFEVEEAINLKKDDNLYVFYRYRNDPEVFDAFDSPRRREFAFIADGSVNGAFTQFLQIEGFTAPVTTLVKVLPIFESLNRLIAVNTGLNNPLISNYYGRTDLGYAADGCGSKRWFTNGSAIRNFEVDGRPPELSLQTALRSLAAIDDIGFGFEKHGDDIKVVMEESEHFYQDKEIMKIDRMIKYHEEIADELIYNEIVVEFAKYINEELNTLDSFHTKAEHLTPIESKALKLNLFIDFITDPYSFEYTRRQQFEDSPTEAWRYDNDIFITDWVEITGIKGGTSASNRLNYQGQVFIGNDSVITIPLVIPELIDLTTISWVPIGGVLTEYTVDSVVFNENDGTTIITVVEATSQQSGSTEFIFGDGFSFKRPESDQAFSTVDNLISPATTYNLRMSLKRIMMKHAKWINSGLHYKDGTDIIQTTTVDHNKTLETQFREGESCLGGDLNRILLNESADLTLNDLKSFGRYFIPLKVHYEAELKFEENEYLRKALTGVNEDDVNYGYISVLNEEGGYTKVFVNKHEYMPFSSKIIGWGYKKYN